MSAITTHVLDTSRGRPAAGVPITLEVKGTTGWHRLGQGLTDPDGRLRELLPAGHRLAVGVYRLTFDTETYFATSGVSGFYPMVQVVFALSRPDEHHHVPLLLSPFGYSTYRGS
jgi:5-hydroxyisourate hydrolase